MSRDVLPTGLCSRIHHGWDAWAHTGGSYIYRMWIVTQANQHGWTKETGKKCSTGVIHTTTRVWLSNSGTRPLSLPLCLSTCSVLSPPNKYFTCFTTFPLWKFFSSNQRPGPLSLTTGLEARIWCSHRQDPAPFSGWEPRPTPSRCRMSAPEIIPTAGFTRSSKPSRSPHPCSWHPGADRLSAIFTPSGTGILLPVFLPLHLRHSKFCF